MKTSLKTLSYIFFIPFLLLISPLHTLAGKETSAQEKDILLRKGDQVFKVSIEDIKERFLKGELVEFVEEQAETKRTIKAEWITDALKKEYGVERISIINAIITGDLDFRIKDNLVNIDKSGIEVDEIKKQKDRDTEKVFIISSSIYILDCQLQGNLKAGYDGNLKSFVMFNKDVTFSNSTVNESDFGYASFNHDVSFYMTSFNGYANFELANFSGNKNFRKVTCKNGVSFRNVNLSAAALDGASLSRVNLSGADLTEIDLSKTVLINANFSHSIFKPTYIGKNIILGAKGLSSITFDKFDKIVELRNEARKAGFRSQEKQLTAALRKYRFKVVTLRERFFEYVFFDYPTDYGAKPWRSLEIFGAFFLVFSIPYMISLRKYRQDGIWKVWVQDRARVDLGRDKPERLTTRGYKILLYGLYFSLLSSFHIGWRDLNVGSWIARIQPREYSLKATGWVRVVSGAQSLISIYLLALWALTQFGRPFE